ncbi:hypothetical protein D3C80_1939770 [compost metagenome]
MVCVGFEQLGQPFARHRRRVQASVVTGAYAHVLADVLGEHRFGSPECERSHWPGVGLDLLMFFALSHCLLVQ